MCCTNIKRLYQTFNNLRFIISILIKKINPKDLKLKKKSFGIIINSNIIKKYNYIIHFLNLVQKIYILMLLASSSKFLELNYKDFYEQLNILKNLKYQTFLRTDIRLYCNITNYLRKFPITSFTF